MANSKETSSLQFLIEFILARGIQLEILESDLTPKQKIEASSRELRAAIERAHVMAERERRRHDG